MRWGWTIRALVIVAVIGAVWAVINTLYSALHGFLDPIVGPWGSTVLGGPYSIPYMLAVTVVPLPGAAFLSALIEASGGVLLGNQDGALILIAGALQALGVEIVMAIRRYRPTTAASMFAAGALANIGGQAFNVYLRGWADVVAANPLIVIVAIISGGVFGVVAYGIGRLLQNSGLIRMGARSRKSSTT
jgi:energy-coupling factor transport system substrate-specific component